METKSWKTTFSESPIAQKGRHDYWSPGVMNQRQHLVLYHFINLEHRAHFAE